MAPALVHCLLCDCSTLEETLVEHIQYNHMVYRKTLRQVLYSLHYPPVSQHLLDLLSGECSSDCLARPNTARPNSHEVSPFLKSKRSLSKDKGRGKRRKESPFQQSKRMKAEMHSPMTTPAKKPIVLKKPTPTRKKLQSTLNQMLDEDPMEDVHPAPVIKRSKSRSKSGEVDFAAVYTQREDTERATNSINKIRQLQQNELQCTMDQGTYVQCCECSKWRMVREYEDPSLVPEYWVCSMNKDDSINACSKGEGDDVESDEEFVSVEYTCGSMVWSRFPGYPWWPGMVDYCPEKEDTFLVDDRVNSRVAAKYHVVFFDRAQNVARAWVDKEQVSKLCNVEEPPRPITTFKNDVIKKRYQQAKAMALDALSLPRIERIEKYSFATLYTGRWADTSDDEQDLDRRKMEIDIDTRLVGVGDFRQPTPVRKKPEPRKIKRKKKILKEKRFLNSGREEGQEQVLDEEQDFRCLRCTQHVKFNRSFVANHIKKHRLSLEEYLEKYSDSASDRELHRLRQWVQNTEYLSRISETARERRKSQESGRLSDSRTASRSVSVVSSALRPEIILSEGENTTDEVGETVDVDDLLADPSDTNDDVAEDTDISALCDTAGIEEDEIPIEIPFDDPPLSGDCISLANGELTTDEIETKNEPIEPTEQFERVPIVHLQEIQEAREERQQSKKGAESEEGATKQTGEEGEEEEGGRGDGELRETEGEEEAEEGGKGVGVERAGGGGVGGGGDEELDSMDRLRRDLEKLAGSETSLAGKSHVATREKPLRKTGEGEELIEGQAEVKSEAQWYSKPPMSPELLIAIAVRNLDPHKEVGASCSDIVAFISLHFPYFNNNYDECKNMVRRECGMSSSFESGRENFQMRAEINCGDRIHSYVQNNRERICGAMLEPEFLDVIIERFVAEESMVRPSMRQSPPFSHPMLTHLALLKLPHRATLEQVVILLKFLFPALGTTGVMEAFRKDFLEVIAKSKELDAKVERNNITFSLRDEHKEEVLAAVREVALQNLELIGEALLHENFFDIILPIFQNTD